jgi:hypothetical protein
MRSNAAPAVCLALVISGVALSAVAIAQPDAGAPTVPALPDKAAPAPRGEDLAAELDALRTEVSEYRAARAAAAAGKSVPTETKLALLALLASLGWTLAAGLKKAAKKAGRPELKRWLPLVALGMGVAAGFLSSRAEGIGTIDAVLLGAGPPLSTLAHELGEMLWGRGKEAADAAKAAKESA